MNDKATYGLGGVLLGTGLGYGISKLIGGKASGDLEEAVSHITCIDITGNYLSPKWLMNYVHATDIKAALYAWVLNNTDNKDNPQAVMSVWFDSTGTCHYEFGSQNGGSNVTHVYYDNILKLSIALSQTFSV